MTKEEAIEAAEHLFAGMVLDSWSQARTGEAQLLFVRGIMGRVKKELMVVYDRGFKAAQDDAALLNKPTAGANELFGEKKKGK